jgi:serine/threonine protein phosphatase PrpC
VLSCAECTCSAEPGKLYLATAWSSIPHPDKVSTGGEDALFAASHAVGIADGVGGWASQGIDAGQISRALMAAAEAIAARAPREHTALELLQVSDVHARSSGA